MAAPTPRESIAYLWHEATAVARCQELLERAELQTEQHPAIEAVLADHEYELQRCRADLQRTHVLEVFA